MDLRGGRATESLGGGGGVVRSLSGSLLSVTFEGVAGRGGASREDLRAELGDGVVADEDTGLVLRWMSAIAIVRSRPGILTPSWFSRPPVPAGLGLNSPEPPVGIWLARASVFWLVLDIITSGGIWNFRKGYRRKVVER